MRVGRSGDATPHPPVVSEHERMLVGAPRSSAVALVLAGALVASVALAGCTAPPDPAPTRSSVAAPSPTSAPLVDIVEGAASGLSVTLVQHRRDHPVRALQISITNDTTEVVTVTSATLRSEALDEVATWTGSTDVPPGATRDLPVVLGASAAASCSADADAAADADGGSGAAPQDASVTVLAAGATTERRLTATPADPFGAVTRIHGEDCARARVARVAAVEVIGPVVPGAGDGSATVSLRMTPMPGASIRTSGLVIESVGSTVLFDVETAAGALPVALDDAGTRLVTLTLVPARCDPHAVAEDKLGTVFPVEISGGAGDETPVTLDVAAAPDLRADLYAFVAESCGWPAG